MLVHFTPLFGNYTTPQYLKQTLHRDEINHFGETEPYYCTNACTVLSCSIKGIRGHVIRRWVGLVIRKVTHEGRTREITVQYEDHSKLLLVDGRWNGKNLTQARTSITHSLFSALFYIHSQVMKKTIYI